MQYEATPVVSIKSGPDVEVIEAKDYEVKMRIGEKTCTLTDTLLTEMTDWSLSGGYTYSTEKAVALAGKMAGLSATEVAESVGGIGRLEILIQKAINTLIAKIKDDVLAPLRA